MKVLKLRSRFFLHLSEYFTFKTSPMCHIVLCPSLNQTEKQARVSKDNATRKHGLNVTRTSLVFTFYSLFWAQERRVGEHGPRRPVHFSPKLTPVIWFSTPRGQSCQSEQHSFQKEDSATAVGNEILNSFQPLREVLEHIRRIHTQSHEMFQFCFALCTHHSRRFSSVV